MSANIKSRHHTQYVAIMHANLDIISVWIDGRGVSFWCNTNGNAGDKIIRTQKTGGEGIRGIECPKCVVHWTSHKNYICFKLAMASTATQRVSDKIRLDHHTVSVPAFTSEYRIVAATKHITYEIWKQPPNAPPEELAEVHWLQAAILGEQPPV